MSIIKTEPVSTSGLALASILFLTLSGCMKPPERVAADTNHWNDAPSIANETGARPAAGMLAETAEGDDEPKQAGIGAALGIEDGKVFVKKVLPETPAAASMAIEPGDQILAVGDGDTPPVEVTGMKLAAIVGMIRGPVGTTVRLTILPAGKEPTELLVVDLTRGNIKELDRFVDGRLLPAGAPAPDFQFTRLVDGQIARLSELSGHIVVLEFWFTGCHPCIDALDRMEALKAEHPEWDAQVELVGVSVDDKKADADRLFKEKRWPSVSMVWAGPAVARAFRISGYPTMFVIDQDGKVVAADHRLDIPELVKPLLRGKAP
jgi:thiol-disulfide isomerase/thioredoxin